MWVACLRTAWQRHIVHANVALFIVAVAFAVQSGGDGSKLTLLIVDSILCSLPPPPTVCRTEDGAANPSGTLIERPD